jgi:hypothetical protein
MLFELDCLVLPAFVKRRAPYLVRSLVFTAAEVERGSKAQVEIAGVLQDVDELLGIELRPSPLKRLDQDVGRNETLQRAVVRCLARENIWQGHSCIREQCSNNRKPPARPG